LHRRSPQALDGAICDALATIEEALKTNPEKLCFRPESFRVRGELRLKQGETAAAETDFRETIALAQKISAKAWDTLSSASTPSIRTI